MLLVNSSICMFPLRSSRLSRPVSYLQMVVGPVAASSPGAVEAATQHGNTGGMPDSFKVGSVVRIPARRVDLDYRRPAIAAVVTAYHRRGRFYVLRIEPEAMRRELGNGDPDWLWDWDAADLHRCTSGNDGTAAAAAARDSRTAVDSDEPRDLARVATSELVRIAHAEPPELLLLRQQSHLDRELDAKRAELLSSLRSTALCCHTLNAHIIRVGKKIRASLGRKASKVSTTASLRSAETFDNEVATEELIIPFLLVAGFSKEAARKGKGCVLTTTDAAVPKAIFSRRSSPHYQQLVYRPMIKNEPKTNKAVKAALSERLELVSDDAEQRRLSAALRAQPHIMRKALEDRLTLAEHNMNIPGKRDSAVVAEAYVHVQSTYPFKVACTRKPDGLYSFRYMFYVQRRVRDPDGEWRVDNATVATAPAEIEDFDEEI